MKKLTFKNVAEMVLDTDWNGDRTIIVKTVDSKPPVSFGITVKNIFDCNYLIIGVFGGCLMKYDNWDECIDERLDNEVIVHSLAKFFEEFVSGFYGNQNYTIAKCYVE